MKQLDALTMLEEYDRQGTTVWSLSGLRMVLMEPPATLRKTLERLCSNGILLRVSRGVYLFGRTARDKRTVFGELIANLRKGEYCYESLESAASEWGIVSQTPLGALTVVTTGRSGIFDTPFGKVEFVHTAAPVDEIVENTIERDDFIPLATRAYTIHGLRRCGRAAILEETMELGDAEEDE